MSISSDAWVLRDQSPEIARIEVYWDELFSMVILLIIILSVIVCALMLYRIYSKSPILYWCL